MEGIECQRMLLTGPTSKLVSASVRVNSMFNVFEVALYFIGQIKYINSYKQYKQQFTRISVKIIEHRQCMIRCSWSSNSNSKWCELSKHSVKFIYFQHSSFPPGGQIQSVYLSVLEKHSQLFNAEFPLTHRCASYIHKKCKEWTIF